MPNIGRIKSGQLPLASEWNALAESYNGGAIGAAGINGKALPLSAGIVWVKNTSGSDRARFDCMSLGSTTTTIGVNARESVIFEADTADPDGTPVILQEPIANNRFGRGCIFGYTLAKIKQASAATDLFGTPNASNHNLDAGSSGPIQILAAPSTSANSIRPVLIGSGDSTQFRIFELKQDPTGNPTYANSKILDAEDESTLIEDDKRVYLNLNMFDDMVNGDRGTCIKSGEYYFAVNAPCNTGGRGPVYP